MSTKHFAGFDEPKQNWFALPNSYFDSIGELRTQYKKQISIPLKIIEYMMCHQNIIKKDGISIDEIQRGIYLNGYRLDCGTRLDKRSITKAMSNLEKLKFIKMHENDRYEVVLKKSQENESIEENEISLGFTNPTENYFKVPKQWISQTRNIKSGATMLAIEYLMRHAWGYRNSNGVWLTVEEIASGRLNESGYLYDSGIGYDVRSIYRAMEMGIELGLIVWTDRSPDRYSTQRRYNLRFEKFSDEMDEKGQYLGKLDWETDERYELWRNSFENENSTSNPSDKFADTNDKFAHENDNLVDKSAAKDSITDDKFAEPKDRFVDKFADTSQLENECFLFNLKTHLNTYKQFNNNTCTLAGVVGNDLNGFLNFVGIKNPMKSKIINRNLSVNEMLGWILYAYFEPGIKNPNAFTAKTLSSLDYFPPDKIYQKLAILDMDEWVNIARAIKYPSLSGPTNPEIKHIKTRIQKTGNKSLPEFLKQILEIYHEECPNLETESGQSIKLFENEISTDTTKCEIDSTLTKKWNGIKPALKDVVGNAYYENYLKQIEIEDLDHDKKVILFNVANKIIIEKLKKISEKKISSLCQTHFGLKTPYKIKYQTKIW
jgi:hypothetical protein